MNRSILITGASRGIGRAIAVSAAGSGMFSKIVLNSRKNSDELERTKEIILSSSDIEVITSQGDVGDISYVKTLRDTAGEVDVLINNAAISYTGLLIDMSPDEWNEIVTTNISSIYNTCHTFVPDMISRKCGHIINISSVWGEVGASCEVAYSATKGAVNSFTRALAKELGPSHIQVNALELGIVDTDMNSHLNTDEKEAICEDIPMGRMAHPEEIGRAVASLLNMPEYFTGEIVRIDGGWI